MNDLTTNEWVVEYRQPHDAEWHRVSEGLFRCISPEESSFRMAPSTLEKCIEGVSLRKKNILEIIQYDGIEYRIFNINTREVIPVELVLG